MKTQDYAAPQRGWRTGQRGQTMAEFVLVALPFLTLVFGIIAFALAVYTYSFVCHAARDAVRYAVVHGANSSSPASATDLQNYVRGEAQGLYANNIDVSSCWNPQSNTCPDSPAGNNQPGSVVQVKVTYNFQPLYPFLGTTLPLSSSAQMVISH